MVEPVSNVFLQSLDDLLVEEIEHLVGASDEAEQAKKDLRIIHSLLMKADSNRHDSPTLKDHITQLKDLASKAENVLETSYAMKAAFNQEADHMETFQRYICVLRERYSVCMVRRDTRDIISGLSDLTNSLAMELGRETETSSISTAMSLDQPFVGMEKDMELLLSMVKDESVRKRVVKISGMSGLGKRALLERFTTMLTSTLMLEHGCASTETFSLGPSWLRFWNNLIPTSMYPIARGLIIWYDKFTNLWRGGKVWL